MLSFNVKLLTKNCTNQNVSGQKSQNSAVSVSDRPDLKPVTARQFVISAIRISFPAEMSDLLTQLNILNASSQTELPFFVCVYKHLLKRARTCEIKTEYKENERV